MQKIDASLDEKLNAVELRLFDPISNIQDATYSRDSSKTNDNFNKIGNLNLSDLNQKTIITSRDRIDIQKRKREKYHKNDSKNFSLNEIKKQTSIEKQLEKFCNCIHNFSFHPHNRSDSTMKTYQPGSYLRIIFNRIPTKFVDNLDGRKPVIIGCINKTEDNMGFVQGMLKRQSRYKGSIKNQDSLMFSLGWRKFNSIPTFGVEESCTRMRMIKYIPERTHCIVVFWGPICPPNTGFLCVRHGSLDSYGWRLLASGSSFATHTSLRVVKKLKLLGTPYSIYKHTALIQGMFNTDLEASKFRGALIRTPSGIRGTIKQVLGEPLNRDRKGSFRAVFEDKLKLSDIVLMRSWIIIRTPKSYDPIMNLITPTTATDSSHNTKTELSSTNTCHHSLRLFTPASNFIGQKKRSIFKIGESGRGYYEDV
eukprot:gnl/TRDRNA2_/TRDRNA2_177888_c1_seq4.p1 gnl/TRDRNA2_/TRDRNA2_177888_c1~~gnl/TRDRNA2_/TRDRNA2_177888_c1_seq4.p1  ORF type:complete len:423 (+),score=-27.95 gnl/TRDRNA2_/TRDRNA2_177888_c1_seq4:1047-2315(+)